MPHIDEFFPSKYLKASDLQGRDVRVTIASLNPEQFENDGKTETKLVCYFAKKEKGVVLNKTNAATIATAYGYDYTQWPGNQITLYVAMVDAWGETREAIRVRVTAENMRAVSSNGSAPSQPEPPPPAEAPVEAAVAEDDDDGLPF